MIDIQHESIIREWASLRQWAQQEADFGKWYQRVEDRARVGRGRVYLMDDELTAALNARERGRWNEAWSRRYAGDDGLKYAAVVDLLDASLRQHIKATRWARMRWAALLATTVVFAGLLVTVIGLLGKAEVARSNAEEQKVVAERALADARQSRERADAAERRLSELTDQPIPKLGAVAAADAGYSPCAPLNAGATQPRTTGQVLGVSLHFATNRVNPKAYKGWSGELATPVLDAHAMQQIAARLGYRTNLYLDNHARSDCLAAALKDAAATLRSGDSLLLTMSGHGSQAPDKSGAEPDKKIGTWVLFDNQVLATDIYDLFTKLEAGVTVIVVEDISYAAAFRRPRGSPELAATLLVLAGTRENQTAMDGQGNGAFTSALLSVWNNGQFSGSYFDLIEGVKKRMPSSQVPQLYVYGDSQAVMAWKPFRLSGPAEPNRAVTRQRK